MIWELSEEWQQDQLDLRAHPAPAGEDFSLKKVNPAAASAADVQETAAVPVAAATQPSFVSQQLSAALRVGAAEENFDSSH